MVANENVESDTIVSSNTKPCPETSIVEETDDGTIDGGGTSKVVSLQQESMINALESYSQLVKASILEAFHCLDHCIERLETSDNVVQKEIEQMQQRTDELKRFKATTCNEMDSFW